MEGSLFSAELTQAVLPNLDPTANNILMVSTFNEWHEDTQIEPTVVANPTTTDSSGLGTYTQGYSYSGYGNLYLDLLHAATVLAGDYNRNGVVDAADYVLYRKTLGQTGTTLAADGNNNGQIDSGDYVVWRTHFGQTFGSGSGANANAAVPEPAIAAMLIVAAACWYLQRRRAV
jgi:hypothetical protein